MRRQSFIIFSLGFFILASCAEESPFLTGYIKRASDAVMTPCDPYNKGSLHTCLVFSSAFNQNLIVYDATAEELVLAPIPFFPLKIKVGPATNDLVTVKNVNEDFPYFLALDPAEAAIYIIRAFPSSDKKHRSFEMPLRENLVQRDKKPFKMAAWAHDEDVIVVVTYPGEGEIELVFLDKITGKIKKDKSQVIKIGSKPSHVEINKEGIAVISDEGSNNIHEINLADSNNPKASSSYDIGMPSDKISLRERDFGQGMKSYVAILPAMGTELKLFRLSDKKVLDTYNLNSHPQALYFPDQNSEPCCDGEKNWIALVDNKGKLNYIAIKPEADGLRLKELKNFDLTSEKNLSLSQLTVIKILGGQVIFDPSLKQEKRCLPNNRKMFFISSFAQEKPYFRYDENLLSGNGHEVEAQGQSCEGQSSAFRFGTVSAEPIPRKNERHDRNER